MRCVAHVLHVLVAHSGDSFVVTCIRCVAPQFLLVSELLVYCIVRTDLLDRSWGTPPGGTKRAQI